MSLGASHHPLGPIPGRAETCSTYAGPPSHPRRSLNHVYDYKHHYADGSYFTTTNSKPVSMLQQQQQQVDSVGCRSRTLFSLPLPAVYDQGLYQMPSSS